MAEHANTRLKPIQLELFALSLHDQPPQLSDADRQTLGQFTPSWEAIAKTDTASRPAIFAQEMAALGIQQRDMIRICNIAGVTATEYVPDVPATIKDQRRGFAWIDHLIFTHYAERVGINGFGVYNALAHMADANTRTCYPSQSYLASKLGISRMSVIRAIAALQREGLIKVEPRFKNNEGGGKRQDKNIYTLLEVNPAKTDKTSVTVSDTGDRCNKTSVTVSDTQQEPIKNKNQHQAKTRKTQAVGGGGFDFLPLDDNAQKILKGMKDGGISVNQVTRGLAASLSARGIAPDAANAEFVRKLAEAKKSGARNPAGATIAHMQTWQPAAPIQQPEASETRLVDVHLEY